MKLLPKKRWFLLCAAVGGGVAATMIVTHHGPGIRPLPPPNTPANRNTIRKQILTQISGALTQYVTDHGRLPVALSAADTQICSSFGPNCQMMHLADLNFLVTTGSYIQAIASDPNGSNVRWGTGYYVAQLPDGRIRLTAPGAELGATISIVD